MTTARPRRRPMTDQVDIDGEVVLFDGEQLHHLAGPAAAVWRLADGSLTVDQIADVLAEGYRIAPSEARARTRDIVAVLRQRAVIS